MPKSGTNIKSLIEAFGIFSKYLDSESYEFSWPTHCEHDTLHVNVHPDKVSEDDKKRLAELSFLPHNSDGDLDFVSFHFGSA